MTPQQKPAPWWQTILVSFANLGATIAAYHFLGPIAGGAVMTVGTSAAHVMTSPKDQ